MSDTPERPALPPQMVLYQMAIGHYLSRALHLAAKLSVADLLKDGARRAEELAEATDTHAPSLRRVLRFLASVGVFEEREDGRFALTALAECLRADLPGSSRAMVLLFAGIGIQDSWKELEWCVRTGEPAYRKRGATDPFAEMAKDPAQAANFDAAMADFTKMTAVAVAAAYDFTPFRPIVDVGGGDGSLEGRGAAANDLNMLISTGGRQRSETEFRSLYADAGFRLTRIVPTPARVCVIEGAPA